jgi:hypothetical protein
MDDKEVEDKFFGMTSRALSKDRAKAIWAMRDRLLQPDAKLKELSDLINSACDV